MIRSSKLWYSKYQDVVHGILKDVYTDQRGTLYRHSWIMGWGNFREWKVNYCGNWSLTDDLGHCTLSQLARNGNIPPTCFDRNIDDFFYQFPTLYSTVDAAAGEVIRRECYRKLALIPYTPNYTTTEVILYRQ